MRKAVNKLLGPLGYRLVKASDTSIGSRGHVLHSYVKDDGSFDYDRYRAVQEAGNKRKLQHVWVVEENVRKLSDYIREVVGTPRFGLCHGTRRGMEQAWFRKYLDCEVLGTEISETAEDFPYTIQWDFHEVKEEWLDAVDFIYSNSFDHSYDPEKCLNAWMSCVREGGVCILEHGEAHGPEGTSELDPFGADLVQLTYLITRWGKGRYGVRELLRGEAPKPGMPAAHHIVIQRFPERG